MTRWFVLLRFSSKEPSPCWGGHKDRVSFNPFPLSNGHLDRVSFLLNQTGHLDPTRTTTHLVSLVLITSVLRTRIRKKKANQATRATKNTRTILSQVLKTRIELGLWSDRRLWFVSWSVVFCYCIERRWLGVFIAPNHQFNHGGRLLSMGAPDSVRCASHITQPLGFWWFRPLELCLHVALASLVPHRIGTVHCPVRLWRLLWHLRALFFTVHVAGERWSRPLRWLAVAPLVHRTVWWHTGQSSEL
jgi:hypothetical protein